MSVVWIGRWKDQDRDEQAKGHDEVAAKIAQMSRDAGAVHHNVYHASDTSEGFVIDEWETREGLEGFLNSPEFRSALEEVGFSPPDEIVILEELPGDPQYRW
jgi:heme-degrading monooxygenase HmoA